MGYTIVHKCSRCQMKFDVYFLYVMHGESHKIVVKDYGIKRPYTREEKAALVKRGEVRLGAHNFYGGI